MLLSEKIARNVEFKSFILLFENPLETEKTVHISASIALLHNMLLSIVDCDKSLFLPDAFEFDLPLMLSVFAIEPLGPLEPLKVTESRLAEAEVVDDDFFMPGLTKNN